MEIVARTDVGNVRSVNQDFVRFYQKGENEGLVVLCDGMGGHNAGEIASQMTCDDIIEHYMNRGSFQDDEDVRVWLSEMINHAHRKIKEASYSHEELQGMGTTVVLALYLQGHLYISHVGDSRAYYFQDLDLIQLTKDDTLVNALIDSGTITKDQAAHHPHKNVILQAVGVSEVLKISFLKMDLDDGLVLVCSDGLYNSLFNSQMIEVLKEEMPLEKKADVLMEDAKIYGGKDNIGFALISSKGADSDGFK